MNTSTPTRDQPGDGRRPQEGGAVRAILVGRTGLDASLRRDERIELSRCATPLEAIGELALGPAGSDQAPSGFSLCEAIVLAPGTVPPDLAGFVEAARLIRPDAAILLATDPADPRAAHEPDADLPAGIEGVLPPLAAPHDLHDALARAALRRTGWLDATREPVTPTVPPAPRAASVSQSEHPPAAAVSVPVPPPAAPAQPRASATQATGAASHRDVQASAGASTDPGDSPMVQALLAGRDLLLAAVTLIRARTGHEDVLFVPAPDTPAAGVSEAPGSASRAAVQHGAHRWGWLQSTRAPESVLAHHARWLAPWLALQQQQRSLQHAAMVDDLTGAYNRRYFERYMAGAIAQAQRHRHALTLMVLDLDDFKMYNDRFGHPAGDDILRETVRLLRSVIRPSDRVCRIGGDEFAVVFYEPSGPRDPASRPPDDPIRIAQRFQQQIREHRFPKLGGCAPGTLTVSAGMATYPWDGRTAAELLERADQLAIESKRAGKNAMLMGPGAESGPRPESI